MMTSSIYCEKKDILSMVSRYAPQSDAGCIARERWDTVLPHRRGYTMSAIAIIGGTLALILGVCLVVLVRDIKHMNIRVR
jgi:hypothetical protein